MSKRLAAALACCLFASIATAQEAPRAGVVMGYPSSVGFLFRVGDRIALRPSVSFASYSSSFDESSTNSTTVSGGSAVLVYLSRADTFRTYVAPAFSVQHLSHDSASPIGSSNDFSVSGSFGAQYQLSRRFGLFGEVGLKYNRSTFTVDTPVLPTFDSTSFTAGAPTDPIGLTTAVIRISVETKTTTHTIGTATGVGVIVYF